MKDHPVSIMIAGDFCPINRIEELALKMDYDSVFNDFFDILLSTDLGIFDLECPLTSAESARPKSGPHQKAHPDCINILKYGNIRLVTIANNHIMDYGDAGIRDTLALCKDNGINVIGAGMNADEASAPCSMKIKNRSVAIFNYADNEFLETPGRAFQGNPVDPLKFFYEIRSARQNHDFVIVIVHAGNEFFELPSPRTKKLYRYLIDLGADAVLSHHTHAWSGYEIYNSKPVFYGLGNFIYDWPGKINSRWNQGYTVILKLSDNIDFEIIPLKQCNEMPGIFKLNLEEAENFNKEIMRLNNIIADDNMLENEFKKYCTSVFPMYDAFIEPHFGKFISSVRKRGLFPKLLSRRKRLLLLNLLRCESHRDVLIRLLKQYE